MVLVESNQLLLNADKTKLLLFGSSQMLAKVDDFHVSLMGMQLTPSHAVKDLGVFLDSNLTFNESNI